MILCRSAEKGGSAAVDDDQPSNKTDNIPVAMIKLGIINQWLHLAPLVLLANQIQLGLPFGVLDGASWLILVVICVMCVIQFI